jgi:hypothetical protein
MQDNTEYLLYLRLITVFYPANGVVMKNKTAMLIDESHRQAWSTSLETAATMNPGNPADASYAQLAETAKANGFAVTVHSTGELTKSVLDSVDLFVMPHASTDDWEKTVSVGSPVYTPAEIEAILDFVKNGGGLVVLGETEQQKYGNNFGEITKHFGIGFLNATVQDSDRKYKDVATWVLGDLHKSFEHDLTFRVGEACFYRSGALVIEPGAEVQIVATTSASAMPASAPLIAAAKYGDGRVVVLADSDVFGDDSIDELGNRNLWTNVAAWVAGGKAAATATAKREATWAQNDANWLTLVERIETLRPMQEKDGSIDATKHDHSVAAQLVGDIVAAVAKLSPRFPHQIDYLAAAEQDLQKWVNAGFTVPDFFDSLAVFRPDLNRVHEVENFAIFSMYTQNGNPNRNLEVLITRTFWPAWLAEQEKKYTNPAFVPIEFVAFTAGYDTNSAVFFPETVATRETSTFHWGGIFCDREAARFRLVSRAAQKLLYLPLPPDAERLVNDQDLAQETFVLWDLIHDRTHSRGDLPFDPFMIKQRLGKFISYAILFDRLFRFPITGNRVRNYDGLGGQIIFSWLHRHEALTWTDNRLTFDWDKVTESVVELCEKVEELYHDGIDRSRLAQWMASYEFVSALVQPHPASNWAKGASALPLDGELKELVNLVLPDEFPLNVFYETLTRNLKDVVESTRGITA